MAKNASGQSPLSSSFSSSRTEALTSPVTPASRQGIRRRREGSSDVEIEELDSCTMRQKSYNYFEQQHQSDYVMPSLLRTSTFHSSLGRSSKSHKRQRTLAEQLDSMCLQDRVLDRKGTRNHYKSIMTGDVGRKDTQQYRETADNATFVNLNGDIGQEEASSFDDSGSHRNRAIDTLENDKVVAEVGRLRRLFAAHCGDRRRPLDRMYRHYVTVTPQVGATTNPQGNELVVFRPPTSSTRGDEMAAYLTLTPHEFNKLSTVEKRQWYQAHCRYVTEFDATIAQDKKEHEMDLLMELVDPKRRLGARRHGMSSMDLSCSPQVLDVPSDVEMMEVIEQDVAPKHPRAAGTLTHTEWFTDDDL
uniref:Uncharacterized protein n=1 Tax=Hyaloperonospora arabidopsidis (strain Emoy2) TaxID=559515 RepID=M4BRG7_HYAAE